MPGVKCRVVMLKQIFFAAMHLIRYCAERSSECSSTSWACNICGQYWSSKASL